MNKLSENDYRILQRISNKRSIKIDIKDIDNEYYISTDELLNLICELDDNVDAEQERYEDLYQDMQDNYKPIPMEQQL
jgi:hypothetical protein